MTQTFDDGGGPYFRTETPDDPMCAASHAMRRAEYELFGFLSDDLACADDMDLLIETFKRVTGWGKKKVTRAIHAYTRLQDLPALRGLQEETHRLDISRLSTIDDILSELGPNVCPTVFLEFDYMLVDLFLPDRSAQELPSTWMIASRMRAFIANLDTGLAYDEEKRKRRESSKSSAPSLRIDRDEMSLSADTATLATVDAFIKDAAREHKIGVAEAAIKLLTGDIVPRGKAKLYGFVPVGLDGVPIPGGATYLPSYGWTDALASAAFEEITAEDGTTIVLLGDIKDRETESYTPTEDMRAYVLARDGCCIWPGCGQRAEQCQLDHRVPFEQGGKTTPDNLFALCQHHHNVKTDRRATYIPDPESGEIVWLFADGTYSKVAPGGFLHSQITPISPAWQTSLSKIRVSRQASAEFHARGHAILDAYEETGDFETCVADLESLEREFGDIFPFEPEPPEGVAYEPMERWSRCLPQSVR